VLLVVDVQEKFTPVIHQSQQLITQVGRLIQAADQLTVPIVVSEQYPQGLGHTNGALLSLLPETVHTRVKTTFGCLADTGIEALLSELARPQVVVCGIEAHICVNQSVHQLLEAGYQVHLVFDAVSSRAEANRDIGIQKMIQSGAVPSCVEMVLFEWLQDATHPAFKPVQALIK
jgi:nicotinamidase-related amidase